MKKISIIVISLVFAAVLCGTWLKTQNRIIEKDGDIRLEYSADASNWKALDQAVFESLNHGMQGNSTLIRLWGISNARAFDLVPALFMLLLALLEYRARSNREQRLRLIRHGLVMIVAIGITVTLAHAIFTFDRLSPTKTTGMAESALHLSEHPLISWKVKDSSKNSFPGDHSTVLLVCGLMLMMQLRMWLKPFAVVSIIVFTLPRLASGGHWFSDVTAGGVSLAALGLGLIYGTGLYGRIDKKVTGFAEKVEEWLPKFIKGKA